MSAEALQPALSIESLEDAAFKEVGETPAVKQAALNELRKLISDEPSLRCPTDDAFLVRFLRSRKYNTQGAFENLKKYFKARKNHPEMFKDLTPSMVPFDAVCSKHRLITVSRHRDTMGRIPVLVKAGAWNTEVCTVNDFIRVVLVLFEHFLRWDDSLLRGTVIIADLKGLNLYHMTHYTPSLIRTAVGFVQDSMPVRVKGIYVINSPPIFDVFFGIAKTFLKTKLLKRVRLFGYDPQELHQLVPDDVIPEEHGGTNESYDYEPLERELQSEEGYFQNLGSYGYLDTPMETELEPDGSFNDEITLSEEYVHL